MPSWGCLGPYRPSEPFSPAPSLTPFGPSVDLLLDLSVDLSRVQLTYQLIYWGFFGVYIDRIGRFFRKIKKEYRNLSIPVLFCIFIQLFPLTFGLKSGIFGVFSWDGDRRCYRPNKNRKKSQKNDRKNIHGGE